MDRQDEGATDAGIPVGEFDAVCEGLEAWATVGGAGTFRRERVEGEDGSSVERAVCDFGTASFVVTSDGHVEGGMPLHGFEGRAERLVIEDDAVRVVGADVAYVYRRP